MMTKLCYSRASKEPITKTQSRRGWYNRELRDQSNSDSSAFRSFCIGAVVAGFVSAGLVSAGLVSAGLVCAGFVSAGAVAAGLVSAGPTSEGRVAADGTSVAFPDAAGSVAG